MHDVVFFPCWSKIRLSGYGRPRRDTPTIQGSARQCRGWFRRLWSVFLCMFIVRKCLQGEATMGYRLFTGPDRASQVGLLLKVGSDFPETISKQIEDWNTTLVPLVINTSSTRGLLKYEDTTFGRK